MSNLSAANNFADIVWGQTMGRSWANILRAFSIVAIVAVGQFGQSEVLADETSVAWLTGAKLAQDIDRPFSASWTRAELRQMLREAGAERRIAIVLDRRIDPSAEFRFDAKNGSLRTGLTEIAEVAKGDLSMTENFVYLGPKTATRQLRTLIELRKLELQSKATKMPDQRRSELQRRRTIEWHDLDTAREVLQKISDTFRLKISNNEVIPHDLWAATVLPDVSPAEALSVVLLQFDLTFRWSATGTGVELISIPERISIERTHHSKRKPADAIALIHQRFPDLETNASEMDVIVMAMVEEHEAIERLLRGEPSSRPARTDAPVELRKRLFTFSVEQPVPLSALMKHFEASDIHFDYNSDELKAAGIDLEQTVQPNVTKLPAETFFKSIFGPVGLDLKLDGITVKLTPKRSAPLKK